jgi:RNA polymerase sigma factor (sigma-70 family)
VNNDITAEKIPPTLELVKRAQEGDADAFAALFYSHKARIYSVCLRMTNNVAEAEDLTQDTFVLAFRKLASFRGASAFSTWLHRISINTVLMHFRKKSLRQVSLDEPYRNEQGGKARLEIGIRDKDLAGYVDRIAMARAIKELPPGYRQSFCCTKSRATNTRRLQRCSVAARAPQNPNCTRPSCESANGWHVHLRIS